jgi:ankyrin repeat protein
MFGGALVCLCLGGGSSHAGSFEDYFVAVRRDNMSTVLALLLRGFDVNTLDEKGQHALHVALRADSLEVALFLAKLTGVNVNASTPQGETPLMIAALRGHIEVARALVAQGADVNKPGWTPLHYAATHAGPAARELVALLLEQHAYIDAESPNGTTPLMMAAQYGEPDVLRLLLDEGADPALRNQQKLSALDFAELGSRPTSAEIIHAHVKKSQPKGKW